MAQRGLGRLFDLSVGFVPVDMQTAANTGKRVSLKKAGGLDIVIFKALGTAGDDPVVTLKQHTASSSGTTANLAAITDYHYKASLTTLAGTETWTKVTQSAAATITDPGGLGTSAESQMIIVIPVEATALSDGYSYVSLDVADVGGNAQLGCVLYLVRDLAVQRTPANLPAALS